MSETLRLEPTPPEIKRYQRHKRLASLVSLFLSVATLAILALLAGPAANLWVRHIAGDNRWLRLTILALLYAVILEAVTVPGDFYSGFVLEHRHQLSNQSLRAWIGHKLKGYLVGGLLGILLLFGLYALLWNAGPWWWLWTAVAWLVVSLVLGQLFPVLIVPLFYKVTALDDPPLLARLQRLAHGTGLAIEGIYRLHLSAETKKANAALAGMGRTRRVLLGDTLLGEFSAEEIEVVFAHEIGHHVYRHLIKGLIANVVITMAGLWIVSISLNALAISLGYPSDPLPAHADPAALPLLLLILTLFGLILGPLLNALGRYFECQCDRYALERTHAAGAFQSAFIKLARLNKADPDPNPVWVWLFDDHPPIRQRLAMASAFEQQP